MGLFQNFIKIILIIEPPEHHFIMNGPLILHLHIQSSLMMQGGSYCFYLNYVALLSPYHFPNELPSRKENRMDCGNEKPVGETGILYS